MIENGSSIKLTRSGREKTFPQRLLSTALWWGLPMVGVELIGIPMRMWGYILIFVIPATMAGVFCGALIEHFAVRRVNKTP